MNTNFLTKMDISLRVSRQMKALCVAGVLSFLALGSANSIADGVNYYGVNFSGLPGIVPPSLPAFGTYVNVNFTKGSSSSVLKVTEKSSYSTLLDSKSPYAHLIRNTDYNLTANFSSSGTFLNGTVSISGKITSLGITSTQLLMTADLTAFNKSSNGYLYGFNTNNIWCNSIVDAAVQCTPAEAVYLGLFSSKKSLNKSWSTRGVALTSVPVPAAAWLFGSGLLGLASVARRKS